MEAPKFDELLFKTTSMAFYHVSPFHTEEYTDRFLVFTSQRVYDEFGNHTGTIIGITGPTTFQQILDLGSLSYTEARSYYITNPNTERAFVRLSPDNQTLVTFEPSNDLRNNVVPSITDVNSERVVEFTSFDDEPVLAVTTWLPVIKVALVLEVPQTVITQPVQESAVFQISILIVALIALGVIIWLGTRQIVIPIQEVSNTAKNFASGDMQARATVKRNDEIGLLAHSFNQVADQLVTLYRSLESQVTERTEQVRAASEVAQIATSATSLDEMLARTVNLIIDRFGYYHAAVYLLDRSGEYAELREAAGEAADHFRTQGFRIAVGARSIIGRVAQSNKPWIAPDVKNDPYYMDAEELSETRSEAAVPMSIGPQILGVLDVHSKEFNGFEEADVTTLQTLASQIASGLQNLHLLEATQVDLQSANLLYQNSHALANASTQGEILQILAGTLQNIPLAGSVFQLQGHQLHQMPKGRDPINLTEQDLRGLFNHPINQVTRLAEPKSTVPEALRAVAEGLGCQAFVVIPLKVEDQILGVLLLGSADPTQLTTINLEPYYSIAEMAITALEKITAIHGITTRFNELQSLNAVSQAISTETNLNDLFGILHHQITQAIGDVNFLIALYDAETQLIEIPFMEEEHQIVSIPPFPLGQGLTSILIRTRQPLMIVEDTVNRTRALGAIITSDRPAKSWLGVPMLVGGEVFGAIVAQDVEQEHRFDNDDLRLLTTLAGQVAPAIRNARLLAEAQAAAERDRQLYEITDKIRKANSIQAILEITTQELGEALNLNKAKIEIAIDPENGTEEKSA